MKIAIVHDYLTKIGGAEKVLLTLRELYPSAPIFTLLYDKEGTNNLFESNDCTVIASSLNKYPGFLRRRPKLFLPKISSAIEEFDLSDYDVVISLSSAVSHGVLTKPSTLHISYCFSPARYAWDWYHEYMHENNIGFGIKGLYVRNLIHKLRIWDRLAAHRVDAWIAQSVTVQKRIKKYYQADSYIIYPPTDVNAFKPTDSKPDDYLLIISRLEPYKKIDLAIEACNKLKRKLVIIGKGSDELRLKSLASEYITFLGWQTNEEVRHHMSSAYAFIFPGEEDFGLTPIESMASGRPVIAYNKGGVTESVIAGKTGVFFNESTSDSLAKAIHELDSIYQNIDPKLCREQAEKFSKDMFKTNIKKLIEETHQRHHESK